MQKIKAILSIITGLTICFALSACQPKPQADNVISVGVIAGPMEELMQTAKDVARKNYNTDLTVVTFTDYALPNAALNDGSIDANIFQHQPYLDAAIKAGGFKIVAIGKTFIFPMGAYSKKYKNVNEIPDNAIVAIPNDPSNEARALLLLEKTGLIKLKYGTGINATPADIINNPKRLKIKELDAAQLPRVLDDVAVAIINNDYAAPAGLSPSKNAIFAEDKNSPYANLIVVRMTDKDKPKSQTLIKIMHSPEVAAAAEKVFGGESVRAW